MCGGGVYNYLPREERREGERERGVPHEENSRQIHVNAGLALLI